MTIRRSTRPQPADPINGLTVTLQGTPRALPRARHIPGRRKPVSLTGRARAYAAALTRLTKGAVDNLGGPAVLAQAWGGLPLAVDILAQFPTPNTTRWGKLHTVRPDSDNITKLAYDALMRAGALGGDDSRVAGGTTVKRWGRDGFLSITVRLASEEPTRPESQLRPLDAAPAWLRR